MGGGRRDHIGPGPEDVAYAQARESGIKKKKTDRNMQVSTGWGDKLYLDRPWIGICKGASPRFER